MKNRQNTAKKQENVQNSELQQIQFCFFIVLCLKGNNRRDLKLSLNTYTTNYLCKTIFKKFCLIVYF